MLLAIVCAGARSREWFADGTLACACYTATVACGRHNGVCLLGDNGSADGTTACACYGERRRHNRFISPGRFKRTCNSRLLAASFLESTHK